MGAGPDAFGNVQLRARKGRCFLRQSGGAPHYCALTISRVMWELHITRRLRPAHADRPAVERHLRRPRRARPCAATLITSNRAVDEWVARFDDPIFANSALDRFAHRAHQIVMDGPSLRAARGPGAVKAAPEPRKPLRRRDSEVWVAPRTWRYEALRPSPGAAPIITSPVTPERTCSR